MEENINNISNANICYDCKFVYYDGLYCNGYCKKENKLVIDDKGCKILNCKHYDKNNNV